jgi:hypothetical protein
MKGLCYHKFGMVRKTFPRVIIPHNAVAITRVGCDYVGKYGMVLDPWQRQEPRVYRFMDWFGKGSKEFYRSPTEVREVPIGEEYQGPMKLHH